MTAIEEIETAIGQAADRFGPSVAGIGRGWGVGSGIVIEAGKVLTTARAARHDDVAVTFSDGRREDGRVLAADEELGLAVLETDTGDAPAISWPDADATVATGRFVLALANPGGRGLRATPGFVSSATSSFRGPRGRRVNGAIEHTAPLPRGSSGGPLLDAEGRLVGINALRVDHGLILAIPATTATRARVDALGRGERTEPVRLGIAVAPPRVARKLRRAVGLPERDGVLVRAVQDGSPADRAGLERGDLLVTAAGAELTRLDSLYEALDAARKGGKLELGIVRGIEERSVEVVL